MIITIKVDCNGIHNYVSVDVEGLQNMENPSFLSSILEIVRKENERNIENA